jgi:hypothetical protein
MGIDTEGKMVIGEDVEKIKFPVVIDLDDLGDWAYKHKMETLSPWYDCAPEYWTIGFEVKDVPVAKMNDKWMADIKAKAAKFEELTGTKARLIGMQNVC